MLYREALETLPLKSETEMLDTVCIQYCIDSPKQ